MELFILAHKLSTVSFYTKSSFLQKITKKIAVFNLFKYINSTDLLILKYAVGVQSEQKSIYCQTAGSGCQKISNMRLPLEFLMKLKKIKRNNPLNKEDVRFYLIPEYAGELNIDDLAESISNECTISNTDTKAVLEALTKKIPWYLENGFIIQLGAMGRLKLSISSEGKTDEKDLTVHDVAKTRVLFTPSSSIKRELDHTSFTIS